MRCLLGSYRLGNPCWALHQPVHVSAFFGETWNVVDPMRTASLSPRRYTPGNELLTQTSPRPVPPPILEESKIYLGGERPSSSTATSEASRTPSQAGKHGPLHVSPSLPRRARCPLKQHHQAGHLRAGGQCEIDLRLLVSRSPRT